MKPLRVPTNVSELSRRIHHYYSDFADTTRRGDGGFDDFDRTDQEAVTEVVQPQLIQTTPPRPYGPVGRDPITTAKPPEDACVLPLDPPQSAAGVYRFGAQKDSRLEIERLRGRYKKHIDFALDFKSDAPDGIIFYMSDNFTHSQYLALFLQQGNVCCLTN